MIHGWSATSARRITMTPRRTLAGETAALHVAVARTGRRRRSRGGLALWQGAHRGWCRGSQHRGALAQNTRGERAQRVSAGRGADEERGIALLLDVHRE